MDAREEIRATGSTRVEHGGTYGNRAREPALESLRPDESSQPSSAPAPTLASRAELARTHSSPVRGNVPSWRPTITVPTPLTLPRRQPPPILPPNDSPVELAPPSNSSPSISFGVSPANGTAGGGGGGHSSGRISTVRPGLFSASSSPGISIDERGGRDSDTSLPPWRRIVGLATTTTAETCPPPTTANDDPPPSPPFQEGLAGDKRLSRPWADGGEDEGGEGQCGSKLDKALEGLRSGAPASGLSSARREFSGERASAVGSSWGRSGEVEWSGAPRNAAPRSVGVRSSASGMPSWSEWVARHHQDDGRRDGSYDGNRHKVEDRSGSEAGGTYPAFSMSGFVAQTISANSDHRRDSDDSAANYTADGGPTFGDARLPVLPRAGHRSHGAWTDIPSSKSDTQNQPNRWDSLVESGPILSLGRAQLRLEGLELPDAAESSNEAAGDDSESGVTLDALDDDGGGGGRGIATPTAQEEAEFRVSSEAPVDVGADAGDGREDVYMIEGHWHRTAGEDIADRSAAAEDDVVGGGKEGEEERRRRLAPAELQVQLMNELELQEDLQDAEMKADGLVAAAAVEEARQGARAATRLLEFERVS